MVYRGGNREDRTDRGVGSKGDSTDDKGDNKDDGNAVSERMSSRHPRKGLSWWRDTDNPNNQDIRNNLVDRSHRRGNRIRFIQGGFAFALHLSGLPLDDPPRRCSGTFPMYVSAGSRHDLICFLVGSDIGLSITKKTEIRRMGTDGRTGNRRTGNRRMGICWFARSDPPGLSRSCNRMFRNHKNKNRRP